MTEEEFSKRLIEFEANTGGAFLFEEPKPVIEYIGPGVVAIEIDPNDSPIDRS